MNEKAKKIMISIVVILALAAAIVEGKSAFSEPQLIKSREFGHGTPGHGMKAAERAEEARAAAALKAGKPVDTPTESEDLAASKATK